MNREMIDIEMNADVIRGPTCLIEIGRRSDKETNERSWEILAEVCTVKDGENGEQHHVRIGGVRSVLSERLAKSMPCCRTTGHRIPLIGC